MQTPPPTPESNSGSGDHQPSLSKGRSPVRKRNYLVLLLLASFVVGNASGYLINERRRAGQQSSGQAHTESEMALMARHVNPPDGYRIEATFGEVGPKLLAAGAMDYEAFLRVYEQAGSPLTETQLAILTDGSRDQVVISRENAYFLLNFFWALGLTNQNPILTEGPMVTNSQGKVESYASTGGWSIAAKPIKELYASAEIVPLTSEQQERLEHVAENVYRPCCNNPTHFPDCNHGMAMLGLLQLMASQDASEDEMFEAAKYVNAFWYPSQSMEVATFFKATKDIDFTDADARQVVSRTFSSGSGFQVVHQWLESNGLLQQAPGGGGGCGV